MASQAREGLGSRARDCLAKDAKTRRRALGVFASSWVRLYRREKDASLSLLAPSRLRTDPRRFSRLSLQNSPVRKRRDGKPRLASSNRAEVG